jgi:hypothetical protein
METVGRQDRLAAGARRRGDTLSADRQPRENIKHMSDTPTTRRIRILAMIDPRGHWEAVGSASWSDDKTREALDDACGDMGPPPWGYHWIEADVPVPVEALGEVIKGEVSDT